MSRERDLPINTNADAKFVNRHLIDKSLGQDTDYINRFFDWAVSNAPSGRSGQRIIQTLQDGRQVALSNATDFSPPSSPQRIIGGKGQAGNVFTSGTREANRALAQQPALGLYPDYPGADIYAAIPELGSFFGEDSAYVLDPYEIADENTERSRRVLAENLEIAREQSTDLSQQFTQENRDLFQEGLDRFLPGNQEMIATSVRNIQDNLRGRLNADVQSQVVRFGARRALQSGIGAGGLGRNLTARDIGRTSQDLQTLGFQQAQSLYQQQAQNALATQVRPEQMFAPIYGQYNQASVLTPAQAIAVEEGNVGRQFNATFNIANQQIGALQAEYGALADQANLAVSIAENRRAERIAIDQAERAEDAARSSSLLGTVATVAGAAFLSPWVGSLFTPAASTAGAAAGAAVGGGIGSGTGMFTAYGAGQAGLYGSTAASLGITHGAGLTSGIYTAGAAGALNAGTTAATTGSTAGQLSNIYFANQAASLFNPQIDPGASYKTDISILNSTSGMRWE
jgi:hypothetical protein